jgi:hypothetical protein
VNYWEIISDNLSKPDGVGAASQLLMRTGEQSRLITHTGMTGSGSETTSSRKNEKFRVNPFAKVLLCTTSLLAAIVVLLPAIFASVDPTTVYARAFALLAAAPYVKKGFQVREDYWAGELASGERKAIRQQLFKGNEYWFWLGTEADRAKVSVHIYNSDGELAEQADSWAKGHLAAAHIIPKTTGSYFIIVSVDESPAARTHWALVYGFR